MRGEAMSVTHGSANSSVFLHAQRKGVQGGWVGFDPYVQREEGLMKWNQGDSVSGQGQRARQIG